MSGSAVESSEGRFAVMLSVMLAVACLSGDITMAALREVANPFSMFEAIRAGGTLAAWLFSAMLGEALLLLAAARVLAKRPGASAWLRRALLTRMVTAMALAWGRYITEVRPDLVAVAEHVGGVPLSLHIMPVLPQLSVAALSLLPLWWLRASRAAVAVTA